MCVGVFGGVFGGRYAHKSSANAYGKFLDTFQHRFTRCTVAKVFHFHLMHARRALSLLSSAKFVCLVCFPRLSDRQPQHKFAYLSSSRSPLEAPSKRYFLRTPQSMQCKSQKCAVNSDGDVSSGVTMTTL